MPNILLNGETRDVAPGTTVAGLLDQLGLARRPVAVECNRSVVPRQAYGSVALDEGDRVEVVSFVPGG